MSLTTPEKIRKLQRTFYVKAKEAPNYRFHQLYDKVWRDDILEFAYRRCKANKGAAPTQENRHGCLRIFGTALGTAGVASDASSAKPSFWRKEPILDSL